MLKSHPNIPINTTSENELNILVKDRHFGNKWKKIIDNNALYEHFLKQRVK